MLQVVSENPLDFSVECIVKLAAFGRLSQTARRESSAGSLRR